MIIADSLVVVSESCLPSQSTLDQEQQHQEQGLSLCPSQNPRAASKLEACSFLDRLEEDMRP